MGRVRDGLQRSFLERNQILIGAIAALLVLGGSAFALMLSSGAFRKAYTVTASFADAAGIKSGDDVLVAGLEAGTVEGVRIQDGAVEAILKVDEHIEMPRDARAEIVVQTLMGKKAVELSGGTPEGPKLGDGDVIPLAQTRTPIEILDLQDASVPVLERSDADAFQTMLNEITSVTEGKRAQITELIEGLGDTTRAVDERGAELSRLLDSLDTLSKTFADRDDTLVTLIDDLDIVLANLAERRTEVERLLQATDSAAHETASMVGRNRVALDGALAGLHRSLQVLNGHQIDLAATISYLEQAVKGYASVGYSQGVENRWANIFVQSLGPLGIDAFAGPCGAFDQALDDLLGEDDRPCTERAEYGDQSDGDPQFGDSTTLAPRESAGTETSSDDSASGDLGDILGNAIGDADLMTELRGGSS
ncbi:MAG: MCE family protein [Actinobacteria bacterium]|nr:MCE family protein [Actinomycetota bacterium]